MKKRKYEKGQTLLFVIVAVTIALAIGVSVSTRTISSLRRVSRTDTSTRVIAAAEGGIENLLGRTYEQLNLAINPDETSSCSQIGAVFNSDENSCMYVFSGEVEIVEPTPTLTPTSTPTLTPTSTPTSVSCTNCHIVYGVCGSFNCPPDSVSINYFQCQPTGCIPPTKKCESRPECMGYIYPTPPPQVMGISDSSDQVSSRAVVQVETFNSNEEANGYFFNLEPGSIREVSLWNSDVDKYTSNTIQICWESQDTAIYYYSYNPNGDVVKGGLYPLGFTLGGNLSGLFSFVTGAPEDKVALGYNYCSEVSLIGSPYGLRIKVLYNPSKVAVFPVAPATELPTQGYKLTSRGEIFTSTGSEEKATVIVHKTYPHAPDIFDYGIYTPGILQ